MTGTRTQPAPPEAHSGMLRRGWVGVAQLVAIAVIVIGAAAAIYGERATLRQGLDFFPHLRGGWVLAAAGAELLSMMAFGQLERVLLQAAGARLTLRSVLATASNANAIAISVPVAGSGIATAYAIRDFRRAGADVGQASVALTLAGALSTVAFAILAALGAALSGNTAAALLGLAGSLACAGVAVALVMSLRFPRFRARLITLANRAVRIVRRATRGRPRRDVAAQISSALERAGDLRLSSLALAQAFAYALVNWAADICCLACAVHAVGAALPVTKILLIWSAGAGAASLSPVPGGIGIVDIVLIAAFAGVGVHTAAAVAATLLYRLLSFKICGTMAWFVYHSWQQRRAAAAPARASAVPQYLRRPRDCQHSKKTVT
ncbi:MAG: flippase-like domain-containing protein [Streptosporangiaceae bacterium]|nr:flippase-like domain-containing protein [Streptosporangiaceae bacterium]